MNNKHILIATALIASLTMVSCKNKSNEPTPAEIEAQKVALADSVLAKIDQYAEQYGNLCDNGDFLFSIELSEKEKAVKPDYLLDLGQAETFITRDQKINALCIYFLEYYVRVMYDMPTEEAKAVIGKLATDVNFPKGTGAYSDELTSSQVIKENYRILKERGEVSFFWQCVNALLKETNYLLSKDTDFFFSKISEEQYNSFKQEFDCFSSAINALLPYDEEIQQKRSDFLNTYSYEDLVNDFELFSTAKEVYKSNKYRFIEVRNAMLQ